MKKIHVDEICSLNFELGYLFVEAVKVLLHKYHILSKILILLQHMDKQFIIFLFKKVNCCHLLYKLGKPAVLAYELNTTVISNFRVMDMAAGGQESTVGAI